MTRTLKYTATRCGKLKDILKDFGYSTRIMTALKQRPNGVMVNNQPRYMIHPLEVGDVITVNITEDAPTQQKWNMPVDIVYQDLDIAVINKSPDMPVIATSAHYGRTLMNALATVWGDFVYHPVNRLDKGTSGLMVVARHCLAHSVLSESISKDREKAVKREYIALVHGIVKESATIDFPIGMPYENTLIRGVDMVDGKEARTILTPLECFDNYSLVRLKLTTGRTHQIRVHMSHIGHPLVGDDLYGGSNDLIARPCLHSHHLELSHPITGEAIILDSPLYPDIRSVIETIKSHGKIPLA